MKIMLTIVLLISSFGYAQTSSSTSEKLGKFGTIELEFIKGSNELGDYKVLYLFYQNKEYEYITDIGSLWIRTPDLCEILIKALSEAIEQSSTKVSARWKIGTTGEIYIYDFTKNIYFSSDDGEYTYIPVKKARLLIEKLKESKSMLAE